MLNKDTDPTGATRYMRYAIYGALVSAILGVAAYLGYFTLWRHEISSTAEVASIATMLTLCAGILACRSWCREKTTADILACMSHHNQLLLRAASDGIHVVDGNGQVLEVSDSFCKLLGYERRELLKMHIAQWDTQWQSEALQELFNQIGASQSALVFETRYRRRDGRIIDVEISAVAAELDGRNVLYASARDITPRKQAESALRESERQLRRVIEGSHQGFWDWNLLTNAFTVSARLETILGYEPGEMDPSVDNWHRYVHADDLAKAHASIERHLSGETSAHEVEVRCRTKSGDWRWILTYGCIVEWSAEGLPIRMSGIHTDISDRKRGEAALKDTMAEAEKANDAKSHFLAAASHDLRQPLSALSLYVGALKREVEPGSTQLVSRIQECVNNLSELLADLLDVSKLDAKAVVPKRSHFGLDELFATMVSVHAGEAQLKGLSLRSRTTAEITYTDPLLLHRILGNLVANAIRYTQCGGVLIACRRCEGKLRIEVWDTGIGIPADQQSVIFEEFKQLGDGARTEGSGLGLAIVAKTAALLGLRVSVRSRLGKGSVFAVEVPIGESKPNIPVSTQPISASRALRIALVEDNPMVRQAMVAGLQGLGHQVLAAASKSALLAELDSQAPDIVLSDYRLLQGETGVEVITEMRSRFGVELPAILITGDTDPDLLSSMCGHDFVVLHKPVDLETLQAHLKDLTYRPA